MKALLLEKASGCVIGLLKGHHLGSNMLRKILGKKLSQPIYGSNAKLCSKTKLNKLKNLFPLLTDNCSLGLMILFFCLGLLLILSFCMGLLFSISENPFFEISLYLKPNKYEKHGVPFFPWVLKKGRFEESYGPSSWAKARFLSFSQA